MLLILPGPYTQEYSIYSIFFIPAALPHPTPSTIFHLDIHPHLFQVFNALLVYLFLSLSPNILNDTPAPLVPLT